MDWARNGAGALLPCNTRIAWPPIHAASLASHTPPRAPTLLSLPPPPHHLAASILGLVGFSLSQGGSMTPDAAAGQQEAGVAAAPVIPRENAVLVFGATGRMGRKIVEQVSPGPAHGTRGFAWALRLVGA